MNSRAISQHSHINSDDLHSNNASSHQRRKLEEEYFGRGKPLSGWQKVDMELFIQRMYTLYYCVVISASLILYFWFQDQTSRQESEKYSDFKW